MTIDEEYFRISTWTTDSLTILACLIFFFSFCRLKEKNYSLYMVLVLCIVDFIHPIIDLTLLLWDPSYSTARYLTAIQAALYEFGLCWSTALAVLVSVVLTQKKLVNPIRYTFAAMMVCIIMAIIPAIIITNEYWGVTVTDFTKGKLSVQFPYSDTGDQIAYFLIFDVLGRVLPILTTCFCYLRVLQALKKLAVNSKRSSNTKPVRVLCYLLIQFICFFPGVLGDIYNMFLQGTSPSGLSFTISTLHNCWGFLNLVAYWFLKPPRRYQSSVISDEINDMSLTGMSTL